MNTNSRSGGDGWQEQVLVQINENRRAYLCEHGIVHLKWHENHMVYCPGDFLGLPFMLSGLLDQCGLACERGESCPHEAEDGLVHLPYHSVELPFTREECRQLYDLVLAASNRLSELRNGNAGRSQPTGLTPWASD